MTREEMLERLEHPLICERERAELIAALYPPPPPPPPQPDHA